MASKDLLGSSELDLASSYQKSVLLLDGVVMEENFIALFAHSPNVRQETFADRDDSNALRLTRALPPSLLAEATTMSGRPWVDEVDARYRPNGAGRTRNDPSEHAKHPTSAVRLRCSSRAT